MFCTVNGVRLFFDIEGAKLRIDGPAMRQKPTLVLVHGGPGFTDHTSLRPELSALADEVQLVYFDLRGCGRSEPGPPELWTIEQWADDLRALCDALGIERPAVLGYSLGCFVAATYAARHPEHPAKLILASPQARMNVPRMLAAFERLGGPPAVQAARGWLEGPGDPASLAEFMRVCMPLTTRIPYDPTWCGRGIANPGLFFSFYSPPDGTRYRVDLRSALRRVRCPTLVLAGEADPLAPIEDALEVVAALPPAVVRLERFPDCGHGAWRDDPERGFRVIREFLRG